MLDFHPRLITPMDQKQCTPVYAVWELTLQCNQRCLHCGSRAGQKRADELSTKECFETIKQLTEMGVREITLIGGEVYLRSDWLDIVKEITRNHILCTIQTGAFGLTEKMMEKAIQAGLSGLGVSLDGLESLHDRIRGVNGSYRQAVKVLRICRSSGLSSSVNTQIGLLTLGDLEGLLYELIGLHIGHWQVQLVGAIGNAVDNDEILLQPYHLMDLMPLLAKLHQVGRDNGLQLILGDNLGYFGPYEYLFRGPENGGHYTGCSAGHTVIGLESNGSIKGCLSLASHRFIAGNVRDNPIAEIWNNRETMKFNRCRSIDNLYGFCQQCYYATVCRAGCSWTTDNLFGRTGDNPFCHYRVLKLAEAGIREKVVKVKNAARSSMGTGLFELVQERL